MYTKAKLFEGVHPWRKYDCEYSQPFIEGEPDLNIGSGESITQLLSPSQILDIRMDVTLLKLRNRLLLHAMCS